MRILYLFLALLLTGCGKTPTTQYDSAIMTSMMASQTACYQSFKPDVSKLDDNSKALVMLASQNNLAMITVTKGDPCKVVGVYDAQIAEVNAQYEMVGKIADGIFDLGKWYIGATAVIGIADRISSYNVEGQFNSLGVTNEMNSRNSWSSYEDSANTFDMSPIDSNVSTTEQANPITY